MTTTLRVVSAICVVGFPLLACTAGGDVVPDEEMGGSSGASVVPMGGSGPTAGTGPSGGSGVMAGGSGGSAPTTGGSSGAGPVAGTGPAAGTGPTGGTGGTGPATEDLDAAVAVWNGWRIDMLCTNDPGKTFLSPNCTQGGDICNMKDDNSGRTTFTIEKTMAGDPNKIYKFKLRVRGVVEPKAFSDQTCPPLFQGDNVPMRACKCNSPDCIPIESGFNWMQLNIDAPKARYYMNSAKDAVSHRVEVLNGEFDMEARGGTKITYFFDNLNTGQIRNCQNKLAPDVPFADGNFFIFDVIPGSITSMDAP
jgi:hypothetical protein